MKNLRLKPLRTFNFREMNRHEISMAAGVSWPAVKKYYDGGSEEPSLTHVASVLDGMGVNWQSVTLGELVEVVQGE